MKKIILGNGISAKIFSFYNPEYLCIAPAKTAQIDVPEFQASIILSKSSVVDNFFYDIGYESLPEDLSIPIGWCKDRVFHQGNPPATIYESIIEKKLSDFEKPPSLFKDQDLVAEPYLAETKDAMSTYNLRMNKLLGHIDDKISDREYLEDRIVSITDDSVLTEGGLTIEYSHMVSTIPASVFWKVYQGSHSEPKVFYSFPFYVNRVKRHIWDSVGYPILPDKVMCYFPEKKFNFDRVRIIPELQDSDVIIESPVYFEGSKEMKSARIIRNYDNIAPPRVMFLGRYAQWNPDVVVASVIKKSSQKYFMEDIWSDQKAFNKKFVTYAPDASYVQDKVKDYILHLISEIDSLLNTINWKIDVDEPIPLEREKILEEFIDIFKFWLSIGHMFGFAVDDFARMYWEKSKKIEERYKDDKIN